MTMRTYYPPAELQADPMPAAAATTDPGCVRFGYTLEILDHLARTVVVANSQWWPAGDRRDQAETAWSGIVEHLYAVTDEPTRADLLAAGTRALVDDTKGYRKHHGLRDGGLISDGPRFAAYWYQPPAEPWDDQVVERLAAEQILTRIKPHELDAVMALAATGDYQAAADALDIKYTTLTMRLSAARSAFRRHWFEPDTAPPVQGTDRRIGNRAQALRTHCSAGHEYTPENTYRRPNPKPGKRGERVCRTCETARSAARSAAKQQVGAAV